MPQTILSKDGDLKMRFLDDVEDQGLASVKNLLDHNQIPYSARGDSGWTMVCVERKYVPQVRVHILAVFLVIRHIWEMV